MSRFSPSDAALEGFRLTREKPLAVLVWAAIRIVFSVASLALLFGLGGETFEKFVALENGPAKASPELALPMVQQLMPAVSIVALVSLVFYAVIYTAVLRAILRPADRRFAYLRLSMDEARQFGLAVIGFLLFLAYIFVASIVSGLLIGVSSALGPAGAVVQIVVILALVAAFVYPLVRLSLAPAMTFADGRITLFRSLPVTKGQFWSVFGAYVLALVLTVVVCLLAAVVFMFVMGAIGIAQGGLAALPAMMGAMQPDDMTLKGFLAPMRLANLVFSAILGTLAYLIMFAPAAAIFRELTGRVGAPTATAAAPKPGQPWG
jgi:hypothetical protein